MGFNGLELRRNKNTTPTLSLGKKFYIGVGSAWGQYGKNFVTGGSCSAKRLKPCEGSCIDLKVKEAKPQGEVLFQARSRFQTWRQR